MHKLPTKVYHFIQARSIPIETKLEMKFQLLLFRCAPVFFYFDLCIEITNDWLFHITDWVLIRGGDASPRGMPVF